MADKLLSMSKELENRGDEAVKAGDHRGATALFERAALYASDEEEKVRLLEKAVLSNT